MKCFIYFICCNIFLMTSTVKGYYTFQPFLLKRSVCVNIFLYKCFSLVFISVAQPFQSPWQRSCSNCFSECFKNWVFHLHRNNILEMNGYIHFPNSYTPPFSQQYNFLFRPCGSKSLYQGRKLQQREIWEASISLYQTFFSI